jgi:hypothetical protein
MSVGMTDAYEQLLHVLAITLDRIASKVPRPQKVPFTGSFVYRYEERTAQQAIVQKLARIITGLRAALLLLRNGLLQEQAVMQRVLDELREDAVFLAHGILQGELEGDHKKFLDSFYEEEFDNPESAFDSTQKRTMLSRDKIQAYLARIKGSVGNPSDNQEVARSLTKAFSGFVHAASPQTMEMYGGDPPHFHVYGMIGTERMQPAEKEIWYYFDRGITTFILAAGAFFDREVVDYLISQKREFAKATGREAVDITDLTEVLKKKPSR